MIDSISIKDQVLDYMIDQLLTGVYSPGDKLGLSKVSEQLSISATPVREAFTQLQEQGILIQEPNRGFFVPPLSVDEAYNIYPIIWSLECLALECTESFENHIPRLQKINDELKSKNHSESEMVNLDRIWHKTLIRKCGNPLLIKTIEKMKVRSTIYELFYMKDAQKTVISTIHHQKIANHLLHHQKKKAQKLLEKHWNLSLEFLTEWLNKKSS